MRIFKQALGRDKHDLSALRDRNRRYRLVYCVMNLLLQNRDTLGYAGITVMATLKAVLWDVDGTLADTGQRPA